MYSPSTGEKIGKSRCEVMGENEIFYRVSRSVRAWVFFFLSLTSQTTAEKICNPAKWGRKKDKTIETLASPSVLATRVGYD